MEASGAVPQPQFEGGGPMVLVRNTFLDIEDPPEPTEIARSQTAPPGSGGMWARDQDVDESDEEDEEEDEEAEQPRSDSIDDFSLCRTVTHEWLEEPLQWRWVPEDAGKLRNFEGQQGSAGEGSTGPGQSTYHPPKAKAAEPMPQPVQSHQPQQPQQLQGGQGQGQMQMPAMVLMPVAMAPPMGAPTGPCAGYSSSAPAPELPVRQPDRGARWPATAPVPAGPMPQNTVTVQPVTAPVLPVPQGPPAPPQPQTLTRAFSVKSGFFRVHWTVDGRKLRGNEKQTVSPPFELSFGPKFPSVTFKMMIYPEMVNEGKGGCCFRKSKGRGYVQIKCEAELEESVAWVSFRISIGSGNKTVGPRGPRYHNFSQSAVTGLEEGPSKDEHIWDFTEVLDEVSQTFVVCLEIVPGGKGPGK
eukprot:CAMPEP_0181454436 /NCGR_PEP_ID=MMETSP1110-20121109/30236_1 /TAXON_ID=174948 /ORGANISM="Symbiodinium sp., Strain CCMP421" /LENGTH=412 /DNA_ID=CAMNT_0023578779 /DNA_START=64 /DNA_END=1302 /DNA_ORIENTATION=+